MSIEYEKKGPKQQSCIDIFIFSTLCSPSSQNAKKRMRDKGLMKCFCLIFTVTLQKKELAAVLFFSLSLFLFSLLPYFNCAIKTRRQAIIVLFDLSESWPPQPIICLSMQKAMRKRGRPEEDIASGAAPHVTCFRRPTHSPREQDSLKIQQFKPIQLIRSSVCLCYLAASHSLTCVDAATHAHILSWKFICFSLRRARIKLFTHY